jgi:hypothetical protein
MITKTGDTNLYSRPGRDDLVARLEPRVGSLGRAVEQDHVAEDGVEPGERPVDLMRCCSMPTRQKNLACPLP